MPKESEIQKAILQYLAARRVLAWRMNTGAVKTETRFFRFGSPGMADILAAPQSLDDWGVWQARFLWIECKAPRGTQSEAQKSFQIQVEEQNHTYIVARSIEDVAKWLA